MDGLDTQFNDVLKSVAQQGGGDYASILSGGGNSAPQAARYTPLPAPPDTSKLQKSAQRDIDATRSAIDNAGNISSAAPPPAAPRLGAAPDQQYTSEFNAFKGFAPVMAIFASLKTRHPLTTAMGAMASSMDAYHKGEKEKFELERENYKENLDTAIKQQEMDMNVYKSIIDNQKTSVEEKMAQATAHAHLISDEVALGHLQVGEWNSFVKKIENDNKMLDKAKEFMDDSEYQELKKKPSFKKDAENWNNGLPLAQFIRGRGAAADKYLQGVKDYAAELKPDANREEAVENYNAANRALNSFGSGKQGDTVRSFNVAYAHMDVLNNLIDALGNGDTQAINAAKQSYEQQFGSEAPTNFDTVKTILSDEVNKAAVGGAGALGDREEIRSSIARAGSPQQLKGAVDIYKKLITGQMQGMQKQYEQATGRTDFQRLLLPEVRKDLEAHTSAREIPSGAPTATNDKGEVKYWDGKEWK